MAKTAKQIAAERAAKRQASLDAIIAAAKNEGYSVEQAYIAAWMAKVESNLGLNVNGEGTISGMYQFSDGTWADRKKEYTKKDEYGNYVYPEFADFDWEANRNTNGGQTKVVLADIKKYGEEYNDGKGSKRQYRNDGLSGSTYAKESLDNMGVPWTLENYVYLRHNTDLAQEQRILFNRLIDFDGDYAKIEQAVESAYGKQITDPYDNPSLSPLIKKLADAVHLNIEGMTNQEALGWIRERYSRMKKTNPKGVEYLLNCLSGYNKLETSALWQYWNNTRSGFQKAEVTTSPLALDLDNDGVETIAMGNGSYFDHDGNGFSEQTGWVSGDDGLLVMDRNNEGIINDGTELFGNQTILSNGQKASNGFQALSELDDNKDGKVDAQDSAFNQLKIWQDVDGDGYSNPDELKSLSDLGITAINLNSTPSTSTDAEGNTQTRAGSFEKTDGTSGIIGEYNLQRDTAYTAKGYFENEELAVLAGGI